MANSIIGRFSDHKAVAACVLHLLEIGVQKNDISLVTHHDEEIEVAQDPMEFFQKNGDISSETGGVVVGGVLGTLMGSLVGVASFIIPQVGLVIGVGPLMAGLCGGILGGTVGNEIAKSVDAPYSATSPLHPYIAALKEGDILCAVETVPINEDAVKKIMSNYASKLVGWEGQKNKPEELPAFKVS